MNRVRIVRCAVLALLLSPLAVSHQELKADPCGMIPPVFVDNVENLPIKRVGAQKTYVFYKNGLETFIIRPGYEGKVDEFGMLIPFPVPPAIRKAPDNFFEQLACAIDPPEVVVDLNPRPTGGFFGGGGGGFGGGGGLGFAAPAKDEVQVVRQEAVGMYEVAVLAAGSADALKKWLEQHKYQYPSGMDIPCNEYVKQNWCFVAVKTRVAAKDKADPQPAQRGVDAKLPEGAIFDGHVQAMEFRFASRELVVPMRLSAFNEGETRNIVYLLSDHLVKIRNIPEEYVMRQMSGNELYDNLTEPLPLRILGGTARDIPAARRRNLAAQRDPRPHNGVAAEIFAGDLLAAKTGRLLSEHDTQEKELLAIGEELELRGEAFDAAIGRALGNQTAAAKKAVLHHVKDMVITVVDGEFPREVLAKDNLKFVAYEMPRRKSSPEFYDAKLMGPGGKKPGVLHLGAIDWEAIDRASHIAGNSDAGRRQSRLPQEGHRFSQTIILLIGGIGLLIAGASRGKKRVRFFSVIVVVTLATLLWNATIASAVEPQPKGPPLDSQITALLRDLDDSALARDAVEQLSKIGEPAADRLITIAKRDKSLPRRGWAIAALGNIDNVPSAECLLWLSTNKKQPELVRIWASAARVRQADTPEELDKAADLLQQYPALERPLAKNIERQLIAGNEDLSVAGLLTLCIRNQRYERFLAGPIVAQGGAALVEQMLTNEDQNIRRKAAGFVGTAALAGDQRVAEDIVAALAFDADAKEVPWDGGPLYVPGIQWQNHQAEAKALVEHLKSWHDWCDKNGLGAEQRKIDTVLQSVGLINAAS